MLRSASLALLVVALSSSIAAAQSALLESRALLALVSQPIIEAASLMPVSYAVEVRANLPDLAVQSNRSPWWATTLAVAGPIADGLSTMYALNQSGPAGRVYEGNGFYQHLFGSNVRPGEIMAFKVTQAAVIGLATHFAPKDRRAQVIANVVMSGAIYSVVTTMNMQAAAKARRDNRAISLTP
jgi:hypothetical protein